MRNTMERIRPEGHYVTNKGKTTQEVRVAFYGRVSTAHEAQINALGNQREWYRDLLRYHQNWQLAEEYVDSGITGTQAKKRPGFIRMIEDAKCRKFELIVTREVSRFARNTVDSLFYTRELKKYGVEVYFVNDGLWTFDPDSEIRIAIMSALAQDEARKISERVLAGQHISRQKGILYGNGNILGYRLVRGNVPAENTYEIDEEQAETVRILFDLYVNKGLGIKKIASRLMELHCKNACGEIKWDSGKVSRILGNRTYAGYLCYNKSTTTDFLEHSRKKNDTEEYVYVKGDFPPIVSDENWKKAQEIKRKNSITVQGRIRTGKKPANDCWVRKLVCSCGKSYRRYRWRVNQTGENIYGYQCNNQVLNRKKSFRIAHGLDAEGYCDVPSICQWKLEFMLRRILEQVWENPEGTVRKLIENIKSNYVEETERIKTDYEESRLIRERDRLEIRQKNLTEMRMDGEMDKETFLSKKAELDTRLEEIRKLLESLGQEAENARIDTKDMAAALESIKKALDKSADLGQKFMDKDLVEQSVERVVPCEGSIFKWYLDIGREHPADVFSESDYALYTEFTIDFEEARAYRKQYGNYMRKCQWNDLYVQVYFCIA